MNNQQLFDSSLEEIIELDHGLIRFWPNFISPDDQQTLFNLLYTQLEWHQDYLSMAGKRIPIPRLQAWYGDPDTQYTYSGLTLQPSVWHPKLLQLKTQLEKTSQSQFNSMLANLYRGGQDSVSWHADDEPELGINPTIASLSLGATRSFQLKPKAKSNTKRLKLDLPGGSLLVMEGELQHHWQHAILKTKQPVKPRINLTFRLVRR